MWISPTVGWRSPARISSTVVLPTPFGPIRPILLSFATVTDMPLNRSKAPYETPKLFALRMVMASSVISSFNKLKTCDLRFNQNGHRRCPGPGKGAKQFPGKQNGHGRERTVAEDRSANLLFRQQAHSDKENRAPPFLTARLIMPATEK